MRTYIYTYANKCCASQCFTMIHHCRFTHQSYSSWFFYFYSYAVLWVWKLWRQETVCRFGFHWLTGSSTKPRMFPSFESKDSIHHYSSLGLCPNDFPQFHNDSPRHCFQFWSKNSPSHGNGRLNEIWTPASFMKLHSNIFILKVSQSYAELQLFWNAIQLFKVNFNLQLGNNNLYMIYVCVSKMFWSTVHWHRGKKNVVLSMVSQQGFIKCPPNSAHDAWTVPTSF